MSTPSDIIDRINTLTSNARSTWFIMLGALIMIGITLMRVEHIDFFGAEQKVKLPLTGVSVPTRLYFIVIPILTTAIYSYFHLCLIRLFDALGTADPIQNGCPLGNAINPWLVSDTALHLRARRRQDGCTTPHALITMSGVLNFVLSWGFGLTILGLIWRQSMTARDVTLTGVACACFLVALYIGSASFIALATRMRKPRQDTRRRWILIPVIVFFIGVIPATGFWSYVRTKGPIERLAPLTLTDANIVEHPAGWLPYSIARAEYRDMWCSRKNIAPCPRDLGELGEEFDKDWSIRRDTALHEMKRPNWHKTTPEWWDDKLSGKRDETYNRQKPDFRFADLSGAFLPGVNLQGARMQAAELLRVQLESADLTEARMQGADLRAAQLQNADLSEARLQKSDLRWAQLQGAILWRVRLAGADLTEAQLQGADLWEAHLQGTDLWETQLQGAELSGSFMSGSSGKTMVLKATNLSASVNHAGALRFVDMRNAIFDEETDFRNAFLDGTVQMTNAFRDEMGRPCQWLDDWLDDTTFFSLWHWWLVERFDVPEFAVPLLARHATPATPEMLARYGLTDCEPASGPKIYLASSQ